MDRGAQVRPSYRTIIAFHQDDQADWVADLACGHTQHMRHNPPWMERPWVMTPEGRQNHLGSTLECRQCEAEGRHQDESPGADGSPAVARGDESAAQRGGDA